MYRYYRLTRDFGDYPKGLVVYVVKSRTWMQYNDAGDWSRHSDGKLIGCPNIDNTKNPSCSWCIEERVLEIYPDLLEAMECLK